MASTHREPNIMWIMADDLSWGDLGCFGQSRIATPNIDALASGGMRLTHCYSGAPVCAPSRSTLMQGLHLGHATVRDNMVRHEAGVYRHSLQPDDRTVAHLLRDAGYRTGLFGKWGLALCDQPGQPNAMGFDSFFGYLNQRRAHNYYPQHLWRNTARVPYPQHKGHDHRQPNRYDEDGHIVVNGVADPGAAVYSFDAYAAESENFVRAAGQDPFFLYLAYTPPHGALEVPELGRYTDLNWPSLQHKIWAAMITRMDAAVGRLVELLKSQGVYEDTLIFFVSDNGYSAGGYAKEPTLDEFFHHRGPWTGQKGSIAQGGLRVPAIAHWPGRIPAGTQSDLPWAFYDFLPTAAEAAQVAAPPGVDGISVLPTLLGRHAEQTERDYLYWEFRNEQSLRIGDRYLYRRYPEAPVQVHNALDDPQQRSDLAGSEHQLAARAEQLMAEQHVNTPYFPAPGQTREQWEGQLGELGVVLPNNVDV